MSKTYLHILPITMHRSYEIIDFINSNFNLKNHELFVLANRNYVISNNPMLLEFNNIIYHPYFRYKYKLFNYIYITVFYYKILSSCDYIIWHSFKKINNNKVLLILMSLKIFLKKTIWIENGTDLYHWREKDFGIKRKIKNYLLKKLREKVYKVVFTCKFDKNFYIKNYGNRPSFDFITIPLNKIYKQFITDKKSYKKNKVILVGINGSIFSNHIKILKKLSFLKDYNFLGCFLAMNFTLPWQYEKPQNMNYVKRVNNFAKNIFGSKVKILNCGVSPDKFFKILESVDVVVISGERPNNLDIIYYLINNRIKIYVDSQSIMWNYFTDIGIKVHDLNKVSIEDFFEIDFEELENNKTKIEEHYNNKKICQEWKKLFNE